MGGEQGQEAKGQRLDVGGWMLEVGKKNYDGSRLLANVLAKTKGQKQRK